MTTKLQNAGAVKKTAKSSAKAPAKAPAKTHVKTAKVVRQAASGPRGPNKAASKPVAKAEHPVDAPKAKLVRDSFTIPKSEYAALIALKERAVSLKRPAKKSELLRAGVAVLSAMDDRAFLDALQGVPSLKTGRPRSAKH